MLAVPGAIYRVRLRTSAEAARLHPTWLVGALAVSYPRAEIVRLEPQPDGAVDAVLRWRRHSGEVRPGDTVAPVSEGLTLMPGVPLPTATVESVSALQTVRTLETRFGDFEAADAARLVGALALIGTTAYLCRKIARKHGSKYGRR